MKHNSYCLMGILALASYFLFSSCKDKFNFDQETVFDNATAAQNNIAIACGNKTDL